MKFILYKDYLIIRRPIVEFGYRVEKVRIYGLLSPIK